MIFLTIVFLKMSYFVPLCWISSMGTSNLQTDKPSYVIEMHECSPVNARTHNKTHKVLKVTPYPWEQLWVMC